jgi:hypothetical protein
MLFRAIIVSNYLLTVVLIINANVNSAKQSSKFLIYFNLVALRWFYSTQAVLIIEKDPLVLEFFPEQEDPATFFLLPFSAAVPSPPSPPPPPTPTKY